MKKKNIIAIIIALVIAVAAAVIIPVSIVNCNKTPEDTGNKDDTGNNPPGDNKDDPDNPDNPDIPDNPDNPTPPAPQIKDVTYENLSSALNLSVLDEGATAYCATSFTDYAYENGEYSRTDKTTYYLVGAYFENEPTRIYVFDGKEKLGYVTVANGDGTYFSGKKGGIATNGYCLWLACDNTVYSVTYWQRQDYKNVGDKIIRTAASGGEIKVTSTFHPNCRADFIYYYHDEESSISLDKDALYVGEYHGVSEADTNHKLTIDGSVTNAYAVEYAPYNAATPSISNKDGLRLKNSVPMVQKIFALPDGITGFARTKSDLILSDGQKLHYYNWSAVDRTDNYKTFESVTGSVFKYTLPSSPETELLQERLIVAGITGKHFYKSYDAPAKSLMATKDKFYLI